MKEQQLTTFSNESRRCSILLSRRDMLSSIADSVSSNVSITWRNIICVSATDWLQFGGNSTDLKACFLATSDRASHIFKHLQNSEHCHASCSADYFRVWSQVYQFSTQKRLFIFRENNPVWLNNYTMSILRLVYMVQFVGLMASERKSYVDFDSRWTTDSWKWKLVQLKKLCCSATDFLKSARHSEWNRLLNKGHVNKLLKVQVAS